MVKPKIDSLKASQKGIHPKSRKAKQISKKISRQLKLQKRRGESNLKLQFLGDKLTWFKNNMDEELEVFTPRDVLELIQRYIDRNDDELEQIELKHKIREKLSHTRQHASREDHIKITREREMQQFMESGFETADFLNPEHLQIFKSWSGELRLLPNLKLRRYIKGRLLEGNTEESEEPDKMDEDDDDKSNDEDAEEYEDNE
ncbi:hypothetical protein Pmani_014653 [Petrolisthes manimaculis]|uniref:Translation machinery-associated protein 16 n=1 Tax=Petrolisthes manimaculis TaxID=1843537 RepID=A0AAE1PTJ0_9EUCA|nr:hypothetical protein Pmani_014653 [Petrolisthes manimaculis]